MSRNSEDSTRNNPVYSVRFNVQIVRALGTCHIPPFPGKSAGGLYSGNDVGEGLAALQKSGELTKMLKAARAL